MKNIKKITKSPIHNLKNSSASPKNMQKKEQKAQQNKNKDNNIQKPILTQTTSKLIQNFSKQQQKIISEQFSKMIKRLKKKLNNQQQIPIYLQHNIYKMQNNTQRFQYFDSYNCSKQTIRNNAYTQRKQPSNKYNKLNQKNKNKIIQNKIHHSNSSQINTNQLKNQHNKINKKKCRKSLKISDRMSGCNKKQGTIKDNKSSQQNFNQTNNYMFINGSYVQVDQNSIQQIQLDITCRKLINQQNQQLKICWKECLEEKDIFDKDHHQQIKNQQPQLRKSQTKNNCNKLTEGNNKIINEISDKQKQKLHEQFYNSSNFQQTPQNITPQTFSMQDSRIVQNTINNQQQDSLKVRINVINLQLRTNCQILQKLYKNNKITKEQYEQYINLTKQIYDKEMEQIEQIKNIIQKNQEKIQMVIQSTKNNLKFTTGSMKNVDANDVLKTLFGNYKQFITKTYHEQDIVTPKKSLKRKQKFSQSLQNCKIDSNSQPPLVFPQKFQPSSIEQKQESPSKRIQQLANLQKFKQEIVKGNKNIKNIIDERISHQLGFITHVNNLGFKTSVTAIFQFIKNFYGFLKTDHLNQFLTCVNMPYGYSVQQRLKYLQGHEEHLQQQNINNGIVYGLEEVLQPNLLEIFHRDVFYKGSSTKKNYMKNYEKIHHKAIFDALNQAINHYRPYYIINGQPYPWTNSEKALTYYFIQEDCYQQLLEKVQMEVLKWSSSLCGLIVPEACRKVEHSDCRTLTIDQIFQRYTTQTDYELLEQRESKTMKQQKMQINEYSYQWLFYDEFKTVLLYEISSFVLDQLVIQITMLMKNK